MRIHLEFSPEQSPVYRSRIEYAFRVFCAIYGHTPMVSLEPVGTAEAQIRYGSTERPATRPELRLGNLYVPRSPLEPAPAPCKCVLDGESTVLFYPPAPGQQPDWLGEIFEWLSCAGEYSAKDWDPWECVTLAACYVAPHNLDPRVPYAAIAMKLLNAALCRRLGRRPSEPQSPVPSSRHFLVLTHDVDYLPVGRLQAMHRLAKNGAISCLETKCLTPGFRQVGMAMRVALGGHDPLDQIPALVAGETERGVTASYYFLLRHLHRRDANYTFEKPGLKNLLRFLEAQGMEIGVHGTYTSLDQTDGLPDEYNLLRRAGFHPQGGRQHWLRFTLDRQIRALEQAGARYDTSLGWNDRVGFRAGACFPFPPYNFDEERPATFLEIPMVMMDAALCDRSVEKSDWYEQAASLLSVSRLYGWGGISLLWHPTAFGGGWLHPEIGNVFWRLLDNRVQWNETWLSAADFLQAVGQRYAEAGLAPQPLPPAVEKGLMQTEPPPLFAPVQRFVVG